MIYFVSIKAKESTGKISRLLFCCIRSANGGISLKPVIGLIPLYDDDKESLWMLPGYMRAVETCGGLPVMLPLTNDEADLSQAYQWCDGILFTGGHDVSPSAGHARPEIKWRGFYWTSVCRIISRFSASAEASSS